MAGACDNARQLSYAGTNTCDWFDEMRQQRDEFDPDVVALSFGGNDATECMRHPDGSRLSPAEFRAKYRADTREALAIWGDDTRVYRFISISGAYDAWDDTVRLARDTVE